MEHKQFDMHLIRAEIHVLSHGWALPLLLCSPSWGQPATIKDYHQPRFSNEKTSGAQPSLAKPSWAQLNSAESGRTTASLQPPGNVHKQWIFAGVRHGDIKVACYHGKDQPIHFTGPSDSGLLAALLQLGSELRCTPVVSLVTLQAFRRSSLLKILSWPGAIMSSASFWEPDWRTWCWGQRTGEGATKRLGTGWCLPNPTD